MWALTDTVAPGSAPGSPRQMTRRGTPSPAAAETKARRPEGAFARLLRRRRRRRLFEFRFPHPRSDRKKGLALRRSPPPPNDASLKVPAERPPKRAHLVYAVFVPG